MYCLSCLFLAAVWSPVEKGLTSWPPCLQCFLVFFSLSHTVPWVKCGTMCINNSHLPSLLCSRTNCGSTCEARTRNLIYLESSTLLLGTALSYCVVITMKVSDHCYDLGVKSLGQIYLANFDGKSSFFFNIVCPYIAQWLLKMGTLK